MWSAKPPSIFLFVLPVIDQGESFDVSKECRQVSCLAVFKINTGAANTEMCGNVWLNHLCLLTEASQGPNISGAV